jgi:hypothetical protein
MARRFVAHCLSLVALGVCVPALPAQDHLLDELYGRGVHAYFSRNYSDAYKHLSDAVTSGSKDPRVYYFRSLADNRLNRPADAAADLKMATELEFSGDEPVQVSKALERIQGMERLTIEDARSKARLAIRNVSEERAKIRYENRTKAEAAVLRRPAAGTGARPPAEAPAAPGAPGVDKTDPFGAGTPAEEVPAKPATPAAEAPPAEKPAVPAKPAVEDPFGDAPAKPAAEKPAVPAAEEKPVDPAAEKPAVPAKPAVDDPFGDAPAKPAVPAEKPAAEEKPAAAPGEVKPASATEPAAAAGKGSVLGSFMRAFSKAVPGEAKVAGSAPVAAPPAKEPEPPMVDPNTPDPFGDAPAVKKPAVPRGTPEKPSSDPFADDPPAKTPAKPAPKAADEDPFK